MVDPEWLKQRTASVASAYDESGAPVSASSSPRSRAEAAQAAQQTKAAAKQQQQQQRLSPSPARVVRMPTLLVALLIAAAGALSAAAVVPRAQRAYRRCEEAGGACPLRVRDSIHSSIARAAAPLLPGAREGVDAHARSVRELVDRTVGSLAECAAIEFYHACEEDARRATTDALGAARVATHLATHMARREARRAASKAVAAAASALGRASPPPVDVRVATFTAEPGAPALHFTVATTRDDPMETSFLPGGGGGETGGQDEASYFSSPSPSTPPPLAASAGRSLCEDVPEAYTWLSYSWWLSWWVEWLGPWVGAP